MQSAPGVAQWKRVDVATEPSGLNSVQLTCHLGSTPMYVGPLPCEYMFRSYDFGIE